MRLGFLPGGFDGPGNPNSLYRGSSAGFLSGALDRNPYSLYDGSASGGRMGFLSSSSGWNPYSLYSPGSWGRKPMGFALPGLRS